MTRCLPTRTAAADPGVLGPRRPRRRRPRLADGEADHHGGAVPARPALDLVARLVGGKLGDALGQTIVVDNRSGANGTIGSNMVARAAPDGYTLLAATAGTHVTAVHLTEEPAVRPGQGFHPARRRGRAGDLSGGASPRCRSTRCRS